MTGRLLGADGAAADARCFWWHAAVATAARLLLAASDWAPALQQRIEIATPAGSLLRFREALYLLSLGQSPFEGSAYHGAPLLLPLLARAARTEAEPLVRVAPFLAADLMAGFALWRLAVGTSRPGSGQTSSATVAAVFLWSPVALASCVGCSATCFENAAVLVSVAAAAAGSAPLAAAAAITAAYLGLYPALLLAPLALLLWRGPEDLSVPAPPVGAFAHSEPSAVTGKSLLSPAAANSTAEVSIAREAQPSSDPAAQGAESKLRFSGLVAPPSQGRPALAAAFERGFTARRRPGRRRRLTLFCGWALTWATALAALSDLSLRRHPEHWCRGPGLGQLLRAAGVASVGCRCDDWPARLAAMDDLVERPRLPRHWARASLGSLLRTNAKALASAQVEDISPNIGLQWYLLVEAFPAWRSAAAALFPALALAATAAMSVRLAHRPLFLAAAVCAVAAMLRPYPTLADMALYMGLLPLFWPQLRAGVSVLLLAGSLALLAALGPAMWRMWIVVGSANANYFYAATLLFGAWQAALIVSIVAATLRHDRLLRGLPVLAS